ncbi:MAG: M23 family metallopeptidase, partial [Odoribacter sp.]|nr:M23 family metallopeptidase [Odoribacter sp.]
SILNETSYEEVVGMRLSHLRVFTVLSVLAVILVTLTSLLIAFTGLREFIPGYVDSDIRIAVTENILRVDSLEYEINKRGRFLTSIQMVLRGEESEDTDKYNNEIELNSKDSIYFEDISQEEIDFRAEIEERERFNLSVSGFRETNREFYHFFTPVEGFITRRFDEKNRHYGVDIVAGSDATVSAVLDGVVIFTDWTIKTGNVIQIQHANNLISVYKHNAVLMKKQGDYVRTGEVIAMVGNTGEETTGPHLHFELWRAGIPLDPENFIKFE